MPESKCYVAGCNCSKRKKKAPPEPATPEEIRKDLVMAAAREHAKVFEACWCGICKILKEKPEGT